MLLYFLSVVFICIYRSFFLFCCGVFESSLCRSVHQFPLRSIRWQALTQFLKVWGNSCDGLMQENKTQMLTRCFTGTCADVLFIFKIFGIFLSVYHRRREKKNNSGEDRRPTRNKVHWNGGLCIYWKGRFGLQKLPLELSGQERRLFSSCIYLVVWLYSS